jgi:7-carboxy-7-deazaguanine synthase
MKVAEIFTSIQGESTYAGIPCTFIRMAGCNLRCVYCDTKYAYDNGYEISENEIVKNVIKAGINLVEITGGEPLLQIDARHLIKRLIDEGFKVLLETNGSINIKGIDKRTVIILDVKTPGSGMSENNNMENFKCLTESNEVKFVITNRNDYEWSKDIVKQHKLDLKHKILFSPAIGMIEPEKLVQWMIEDKLNFRLNLQIHKYIFGKEKRGV